MTTENEQENTISKRNVIKQQSKVMFYSDDEIDISKKIDIIRKLNPDGGYVIRIGAGEKKDM
ncbi:hypothetical protein BDAP_001546 [Binucleata daphniae]